MTTYDYEDTDQSDDYIENVEISEILNSDGSIVEDLSVHKSNGKKNKRIYINIDSKSPWLLRVLSFLLIIPFILFILVISTGIVAIVLIIGLISLILGPIIRFFKRKK